MSLSQAISRAAARHKRIALQLVAGSEEAIDVYVENRQATVGGATLFADFTASPTTPLHKGPFACLWHDTILVAMGNSKEAQIVGKFPGTTALAVVALSDMLKTAGDIDGETWADLALHVKHRNQQYRVLGTQRYGMSNTAPYLLAIALAGEVRNRV